MALLAGTAASPPLAHPPTHALPLAAAQTKRVVSPTDTLLVVDAMTGQEAAGLVKSFNDAVDITGAVLTKMDGDSRGGAALSIKEVRRVARLCVWRGGGGGGAQHQGGAACGACMWVAVCDPTHAGFVGRFARPLALGCGCRGRQRGCGMQGWAGGHAPAASQALKLLCTAPLRMHPPAYASSVLCAAAAAAGQRAAHQVCGDGREDGGAGALLPRPHGLAHPG